MPRNDKNVFSLTNAFVAALIVARAALVAFAVVCLDGLPVGCLVGDSESTTTTDRDQCIIDFSESFPADLKTIGSADLH